MRASRSRRIIDVGIVIAAALAVLVLGAPANAQSVSDPATAVADPFERTNKTVHEFNDMLRAQIFEPTASYFRENVPIEVRIGIRNIFANLREPVVVLASGVQGDLSNAGNAAFRFIVNSTIGVVGIFDVATGFGLVNRPEDFGQALCKMGVGPGPYLVLPVFGPTNLRDAAGLALTYWATFGVLGGATTPYVAADGAVSFTEDGEARPGRGANGYERARADYQELRQRVCDDDYVSGLKTAPLGQIIRTHVEKTPDVIN